MMHTKYQALLGFVFLIASAQAATPGGTSANYSIVTDVISSGGGRTVSAAYSNIGDAGGIVSVGTSSGYTVKSGFIAQLGGIFPTSITVNNATTAFATIPTNVNLIANVMASVGGPVTEGTVTFTVMDGQLIVGVATASAGLSNGFAQVAYAIPAYTQAKIYQIKAIYNGSGDFITSSALPGTLTLTTPSTQVATTTIAISTSAATTAGAQLVSLSASVIPSGGAGSINEGTVTFQIKDNAQNNVGTAVTSATLVNGSTSVLYTLPAGTATGSYSIFANYNGTATFTSSSDAAKTLTLILPGGLQPPAIDTIAIDRNPALVGTVVNIPVIAHSTSGLPLSYTFQLFQHTGVFPISTLQSGLSSTLSQSFGTEGDFDIVVTVSDGFNAASQPVRLEIFPLGPNTGTTAANIFNNGGATGGATNPVDQLGITVSASKGGALNFDAITTATPSLRGRAANSFLFSIPEQAHTDAGRPLTAGKFTSTGIRVIGVTMPDANKKAQLMLPIGRPETDPSSALTDNRTSAGPTSFALKKSKLSLTKVGTVPMTCVIPLSSGLKLNDILSDIEFGLSGMHAKISVDARGHITSGPGDSHFTARTIKVKLPKFSSTKTATTSTDTMTISFALTGTGAELRNAGLGTDGVLPIPNSPKTGAVAQVRSLQFAAIVAGMTYQSTLMVMFTPNDDFGSISGRSAKP